LEVKTPLLKNFLTLTVAEIFSKLITFASFAYLARQFGPAGYGYIEWAATVLICAGLIVDQGFSSYGAREIAREPSQTGRLVAEVVTARFLLAGLSYGVVFVFAFWFVAESAVVQLLLVYGLSLWGLPLLLQWVFQGHDRMQLVGITQVIRQTVFALSVFALVGGPGDLIWVGFAEGAGVACAAVFSVWAYRRYIVADPILKPTLSSALFREGSPIGVSQMLWVVKMFGATFIVGLVARAEDTGYFAAAMRIYIALHSFVWLYYFNLLPSLSRAWGHGPRHLGEVMRRSTLIVVWTSLLGGAVWIVAAPYAMTSVYGAGFSPGSGALQWLAGACVAAALSGNYRFGLIAAGNQGRELLATAAGSVLAVILIPLGYFRAGTSGAAAALFVAEMVVLVFAWVLARHSLFADRGDRFAPSEAPLSTLPGATR
jgi:O-antigen/teichoic acid export membrane protein